MDLEAATLLPVPELARVLRVLCGELPVPHRGVQHVIVQAVVSFLARCAFSTLFSFKMLHLRFPSLSTFPIPKVCRSLQKKSRTCVYVCMCVSVCVCVPISLCTGACVFVLLSSSRSSFPSPSTLFLSVFCVCMYLSVSLLLSSSFFYFLFSSSSSLIMMHPLFQRTHSSAANGTNSVATNFLASKREAVVALARSSQHFSGHHGAERRGFGASRGGVLDGSLESRRVRTGVQDGRGRVLLSCANSVAAGISEAVCVAAVLCAGIKYDTSLFVLDPDLAVSLVAEVRYLFAWSVKIGESGEVRVICVELISFFSAHSVVDLASSCSLCSISDFDLQPPRISRCVSASGLASLRTGRRNARVAGSSRVVVLGRHTTPDESSRGCCCGVRLPVSSAVATGDDRGARLDYARQAIVPVVDCLCGTLAAGQWAQAACRLRDKQVDRPAG